MTRHAITAIMLLGIMTCQSLAQPSGRYTGHIDVMGQQIEIEISITPGASGYTGQLSVPAQGAYNLKMNSIRFDDPGLSFRVDTASTHMEFEGRYFAAGDSLSGVFRQSGYQGTFHLLSKEKEIHVEWIREEVVFYNDTIKLAGTLSLPDTSRKYPAVILISGSGQQDRDENVMGFKIFQRLEELFIERDIAVLRYDDRGAGQSDQGDVEEATSRDFAEDARAAYRHLIGHPHIHADKIGMLGHSEGSIIANMVANESDIAFVVMMAGPVMPGHELLLAQSRAVMQAEGHNGEVIQENLQTNRSIYQEVMKDAPDYGKVEGLLRDAFSRLDSSRREQVIDRQMEFLKSPWMKFFLQYDPASAIAGSDHPILALFGRKDTQVPAEQNIRELRKIIQNSQQNNITIITIEHANHLFQRARTGSPSEYGKLEKELVEGFGEKVTEWIREQI